MHRVVHGVRGPRGKGGGVSNPHLGVENNSCFLEVDFMVVLIRHTFINSCFVV
jgi:hypothetical protein